MDLPGEIVDMIVDCLISKGPQPSTLSTIALISPYYLERVRRVRFNSVEILDKSVSIVKRKSVLTHTDVSLLLCASKDTAYPLNLAQYVKELTIQPTSKAVLFVNTLFAGLRLNLDFLCISYHSEEYIDSPYIQINDDVIESVRAISMESKQAVGVLSAFSPQVFSNTTTATMDFGRHDYPNTAIAFINNIRTIDTLSLFTDLNILSPVPVTLPLKSLTLPFDKNEIIMFHKFSASYASLQTLVLKGYWSGNNFDFLPHLVNLEMLSITINHAFRALNANLIKHLHCLKAFKRFSFNFYGFKTVDFDFAAGVLQRIRFMVTNLSQRNRSENNFDFLPHFVNLEMVSVTINHASRTLNANLIKNLHCLKAFKRFSFDFYEFQYVDFFFAAGVLQRIRFRFIGTETYPNEWIRSRRFLVVEFVEFFEDLIEHFANGKHQTKIAVLFPGATDVKCGFVINGVMHASIETCADQVSD